MKSDEKTLIDGLFSRLREAEGQSAPRDAEAEAQINQHLVRQPAAPYYMAQVVLIQEAALKRLDQRVKELEAQVAQLQQSRPSSGGFLSGLFGGGARDEPAPRPRRVSPIRRRRPATCVRVWRPPRRPRLRGPAAFSAVRCRRPLGSLAGCWWPTCSPACSATASRRKSSR
ncbi:hypothetical protein B2G63_23005 [Pseudomonas aeruginosa]|nr:hypothetical protein B2G63_23005 [Pseudomonas aeruginosa]